MSRIGKKPVPVPDGVKVAVADRTVTVEGPLGKLEWQYRPEVAVAYDAGAKTARRQPQQRRPRRPRPCTG